MTRTSQAVTLALVDGIADARTSQSAALVLYRESQPTMISQSVVLALASVAPCVSYRCQCWKITRRDNQIFAFTTHDRAVVFQGVTHNPCHSLKASAFESGIISGDGGIGDAEIEGILSDDSITEKDLAGGLFDSAKIEVWQVSWGDVTDTPRRLAKGIIGKTTQGGITYEAEMLSTGAKLSQRPLLDTVTPGCRFTVGDGRCPVNLAALAVFGAVSAVLERNALQRNRYRQFIDSSLTQTNGYFDFGNIYWVTGDNAGITSEVKSYASSGDVITLWDVMPNEIQIGDTYIMTPGCDGRKATHTGKFGLTMASFGGFPDLPGLDAMIETPNAKSS